MNPFKKQGKGRKAVWIIGAAVLIGALSITALAWYGRVMMRKIPSLSFQEALDYTLHNSPDACITVGLVKDGGTSFTVYGSNSEELPPALHTYEIGSLTKTFTAALVGRAVEEGRIQLDEPIDSYIPLPGGNTYPTVAELLTHTSGYPPYYFEWPMASNFLMRKNAFYGVSKDMLRKSLAVDRPDQAHEFLYSNFGYAALGLILEEVYGEDYTTLMDGFLADELHLEHTRLSDRSGDLNDYWDWDPDDAYVSTGAILSDIDDMLAYARMQLAEEGVFGSAHKELERIDATTKENALAGIRLDAIGMAWIIDEEHEVIWHNGGTDHFNSYLGFDPASDTAVVILSNLPLSYRIPATVLGAKLMEESRSGRKGPGWDE